MDNHNFCDFIIILLPKLIAFNIYSIPLNALYSLKNKNLLNLTSKSGVYNIISVLLYPYIQSF